MNAIRAGTSLVKSPFRLIQNFRVLFIPEGFFSRMYQVETGSQEHGRAFSHDRLRDRQR